MKKHRLISLTAVLAAALPLLGAGLAARAQQAPNKGLTRPPIGGPLDVTKQINPFVEQVEKYPGLTSLEVTNKKVTIPAGETRPIGIKVLGGGLDFVLPNSTGDGWDHFPPEITFTSSNNAVAVAPDGDGGDHCNGHCSGEAFQDQRAAGSIFGRLIEPIDHRDSDAGTARRRAGVDAMDTRPDPDLCFDRRRRRLHRQIGGGGVRGRTAVYRRHGSRCR
jgi:hypothetical protein